LSFGESILKKSDSVELASEFIDHREIFNSAKVDEEEHDVYGKLKSIRFSLMNNEDFIKQRVGRKSLPSKKKRENKSHGSLNL
jgi:hypothetical protein